MSDVTIPLTEDVARAIVLGVAGDADGYNKAWAWWSHDAREGWEYALGSAVVSLVQRIYPETEWYAEDHGDTETELVFKINDRFFRIVGEYSSYGQDDWNEHTFKEVRPTKVTRQVFEAL